MLYLSLDVLNKEQSIEKQLIINCAYNGITFINLNALIMLAVKILKNNIVVINYETIPMPLSKIGYFTEYILCTDFETAKKLRDKIIDIFVKYKEYNQDYENADDKTKVKFWNVRKIIEAFNEFKDKCKLIENYQEVKKLLYQRSTKNGRTSGKNKKESKEFRRNKKIFKSEQKSDNCK